MIKIVPLPAFTDNYIWLLHNTQHAWVVDPGDAKSVTTYLDAHQLSLAGILVTHHHADHIGGVAALQRLRALSLNLSPELPAHSTLAVFGPKSRRIPEVTEPVSDGQSITLAALDVTLRVLEVPGHTDEHIAFFGQVNQHPVLFCGDTLFAAGCGRVFEGTPERLYYSLQKLAQLPPETMLYCTHEYTESNLRFARVVEPNNQALRIRQQRVQQQRAHGQPSLPSTLNIELETNPFLRTHLPALLHTARQHDPEVGNDPVAVFRVLREWKNHF